MLDGDALRGLRRLMVRWPARRADLLAFGRSDDRCSILCAAYYEACAALEWWSRAEGDIAAARAREYERLRHDIEGDIDALLAEGDPWL